MIHRALVYLLLMRLKNAVWGLRKRPARLFAVLILIALFVSMALFGRRVGDMEPATRAVVLMSLLSLYLLFSVFGGLSEPGPMFPESDVDFVFPAPFRRRDVLVYHLLKHYLQMLVFGLFYAVFLGATVLPNPVLTYVGIVLCLLICTHLQTAMTLIAASVSEKVFGRLRRASRLVGVLLFAAGVILAIGALSGIGSVKEWLRTWITSGVAHVVLYPAVAVGDLAFARDLGTILATLGGLLAVLAGTFALVLAFPVTVVESGATRVERKQRLAGGEDRARSGRAVAPVFRGAGAVAWLNVLTLRRRLRIVVGALVMLLFVMLFVGTRTDENEPGTIPYVIVLLAYFPVLANLPLGFKGHREHLELLKTLPVGTTRLALAEVLVPAAVLWGLQVAIVGILVGAGRLEPFWLGAAAVFYFVFDVAAVGISDLFQLGRDRRQMGFFLVTGQMFAILASTIPAVGAAGVTYAGTRQPVISGAVGFAVQAAVDLAILHLLGLRFARFEAQPATL